MGDIDIVIPWVDGGDPEWQAEKCKYMDIKGDQREVRYRDWDVLKYWFRGVEKYADWVHKIHFVTWGHVPEWLKTDHPKLNIVRHQDYIPDKYLPTFSSHPIELNMHRIKGLAEKFVYFNDDFFFTNKTTQEDFFRDGLPCDMAALYPGFGTVEDVIFDHILLNNAEFFAKHFSYREVIKRDKKKWFKLSYGENLIKTATMLLYPQFTGIVTHHQPQSFLKKSLEDVWCAEEEWLDLTSTHRFRDKADISQYAFRYWQLGKGEFYPMNLLKRGQHISVGEEPIDYEKILLNTKYKITVLNDSSMKVDFETEKIKMQKAFEKKFPEKCSFEK